jgi:hypothetical protein
MIATTHEFRVIRCASRTEIERLGIPEFAEEFGHKPIGLPILAFFCDGELVAYCEIRAMTICYPAVHPQISSRAFLIGGKLLSQTIAKNYEGALLGADPAVRNWEPILAKIGFRPTEYNFYERR